MNEVLDASALIALLVAEPGSEQIVELIADPANAVSIHGVNMAEVWTDIVKRGESIDVGAVEALLATLSLQVRGDFDDRFLRSVARRKARGRISLADCFGLALAERLSAPFHTADRRELDAIASEGEIPIIFFR